MGRFNHAWTDEDLDKAVALKATMSMRQVAETMGRSQKALEGALRRRRPDSKKTLDFAGRCAERRRYERNAEEGSAKLLAAILRVAA